MARFQRERFAPPTSEQAPRLVAKPFVPLQVLGVPGWWPAQQDGAFYADAQVFRPPRPVSIHG